MRIHALLLAGATTLAACQRQAPPAAPPPVARNAAPVVQPQAERAGVAQLDHAKATTHPEDGSFSVPTVLPPEVREQIARQRSARVAEELKKFAGTWQVVSIVDDGTGYPAEEAARVTVVQDALGNYETFVDGQLAGGGTQDHTDPAASPPSIGGVDNDQGKFVGIYRFAGDTLEICTVLGEGPPPTEFTSLAGSGHILQVWRHISDDAQLTSAQQPPDALLVAEELKKFAGTWQLVSYVEDGAAWPADYVARHTSVQDAEGNWQILMDAEVVNAGTQKELNPSASPKTLAGEDPTGKYIGIYRFEGDTVEACSVYGDRPRPTEFTSPPGSGRILDVWRRISDEAELTDTQQPPDAQRVARRAMVLALLVYRASLEQFPGEAKYEELHQRLPAWIDKLGLAEELEQHERDLLFAPLGQADEQAAIDASWRSEGLAVLAWALRHFDLPPYDQQADLRAAVESVGLSDALLTAMDTAAAKELLSEAELRTADEIDRYATHATLVNWRLVTYRVGGGGAFPFVGYLREHPSFHESWLNGLRFLGDDLAIGSVAIGDADPANVASCESAARERQIAAYWLQGDNQIYSQVDADTILFGLGERLESPDLSGHEFVFPTPPGDDSLEGSPMERIEQEIRAQMQRLGVPGVSVAVIDDYQVEWARGYGALEVGRADLVDTGTLFQAASISKPLVALAALRLVQEGRLDLDAEINDRLTSWKLPESALTAVEKVTLRRLLSHTAGLSVQGFEGYSAFHPLPTLSEVLDGVPGKSNSVAVRVFITPGAQYEYSGGGYCVVQQLLADVTGQAFPDLMRSLVLDPLDLQHSTYEQPLPEERRTTAASGHSWNGQPILGGWHSYPEMAAAGLWTTPSDLARFAVEVQSAWAGHPERIVSQEMARQMLAPQPGGWGLGLGVRGEGQELWFEHTGANAGFRCHLIASVAGQGAVVMTNSDNGAELAYLIVQAIAREYHWPPAAMLVQETQVVGRNPFGVADVLAPDGKDVELFAATVNLAGDAQDANAAPWGKKMADEPPSIDGDWASRWNVAAAGGTWSAGNATIKTVAERVYILYQEGPSSFLIDAHREGNRLIGKHLNLQDHRDTYPWVGLVVDNQRIDGAWTEGRWDFRRQVER